MPYHRGTRHPLICAPVASAAALPLDSYTTNLLAAWSTARKLLTAYAGNALLAEEHTGNTDLGIGFDANDDTDSAALDTHAGAGDAGTNVLYDQSGNGNDVTNIVPTSHPVNVESGTVVAINTRVAQHHDPAAASGTGDKLERADALGLTDNPAITIYAVVKYDVASLQHRFFCVGHTAGNDLIVVGMDATDGP